MTTQSTAILRRQLGMSLYALIFTIGIAGFLALVGLRAVPAWVEFMGIKKICADLSVNSASPADVRKDFDRRASVEYVDALKGSDLVISKNGERWDITFSYEKRIPLIGNSSLVFDFTQ